MNYALIGGFDEAGNADPAIIRVYQNFDHVLA